MDYLKELSTKLKGTIKKQHVSSLNFNQISFRVLIRNYKNHKIVIEDFGDLYSISIQVNCSLLFSINNIDKDIFCNKPIKLPNIPYKVYASDANYDLLMDESFSSFWKIFSSNVAKLRLQSNESIFFCNNYVTFALNPDRNILQVVEDIIVLIDSYEGIFKKKSSRILLKNIPDKLRVLAPLMKKWSVSGDNERSDLTEQIKEKERKKIISSVDPLINDINFFLNSFGDKPLSEEAILLGNLAELVSELKINNTILR